MKNKVRNILRTYTLPVGFIIFAIASAVRQLFPDADHVVILHYFDFIAGLGVGLMFAGAIYKILFRNNKNNSPEAIRQLEIDEKDERNIRIREKAGYASWHATLIILVVMALVFVFISNPAGYWLTAGALVLHKIILMIFTSTYNKKM